MQRNLQRFKCRRDEKAREW